MCANFRLKCADTILLFCVQRKYCVIILLDHLVLAPWRIEIQSLNNLIKSHRLTVASSIFYFDAINNTYQRILLDGHLYGKVIIKIKQIYYVTHSLIEIKCLNLMNLLLWRLLVQYFSMYLFNFSCLKVIGLYVLVFVFSQDNLEVFCVATF